MRILASSRPGRSTAGSIMSSRLVAPTMITLSSFSTPSISVSSCGTIVVSTSEETPEPRVRNSDSISSKNTTTGTPEAACSRAREKIWRIWRSVSPTYLSSSSGPLMFRKYPLASLRPDCSAARSARERATALAIMVLPLPGGP